MCQGVSGETSLGTGVVCRHGIGIGIHIYIYCDYISYIPHIPSKKLRDRLPTTKEELLLKIREQPPCNWVLFGYCLPCPISPWVLLDLSLSLYVYLYLCLSGSPFVWL